jgi:hypothetical protein
MRLLHAKNLYFEEFFEDACPDYVVFSHNWGTVEEEVTYSDLLNGRKRDTTGYAKIISLCAKTVEHKYSWVWVDTCCIDKNSSAELTEAVHSMFRWYQNARKCFVYMNDVLWESKTAASRQSFRSSRWHIRGWLLQELLAPRINVFYDREWRFIGTKKSLAPDLAAATGIRCECLLYSWALPAACIAERMSWAATRYCARIEDLSYSLMGVFDVQMPLIYGEGEKAFLRLQEEIMKKSDDESIFAWTRNCSESGLLATSVKDFKESGDIRSMPWNENEGRPSYTITNKGIQVHVPIASLDGSITPRDLMDIKLPLNCSRRIASSEHRVNISLSKASGIWRRVDCNTLGLSIPSPIALDGAEDVESYTIYVRQYGMPRERISSGYTQTAALPAGWEIRHTLRGRAYFVNHHSRSTSWKPPMHSSHPQ